MFSSQTTACQSVPPLHTLSVSNNESASNSFFKLEPSQTTDFQSVWPLHTHHFAIMTVTRFQSQAAGCQSVLPHHTHDLVTG